MLKFASDLSDDNEYAIVLWGQSNATPNGTATAGLAVDTHLVGSSIGADVTLTGPMAGTGTETVIVTTDLAAAISGTFAGGELRVGRPGVPRTGYATVTSNTTVTITLVWQDDGPFLAVQTTVTISNDDTVTARVTHASHGMATDTVVLIAGATPTANNGSFRITVVNSGEYTYTTTGLAAGAVAFAVGITSAGTAQCYIYYRDGRNNQYENVRVLQSYLPNAIEANPTAASPLAAPGPDFTALPTTVSTYNQLGLFLNFTFREGITGFGIYDTASAPSSTTIVIAAGFGSSVMVGGVLRAETYNSSAVLTAVATGTIASHANLYAVAQSTDDTDITLGNDEWDVVGHGFVTGQEVVIDLTSGTIVSTTPQIVDGSTYYAIRTDDDNFQIATTVANAVAGTQIALDTLNTGGLDWSTTGTATNNGHISSNSFDLGTATHGLVTGQLIKAVKTSGSWPDTTDQIDGLEHLYAIRVDANEFQIAETYADAIAGTEIVLDTANTQTIHWYSDTTLTLDSAGWSGSTPSGGTTYKAETWLPHHSDNPHALSAGPGFLHPTNESQPTAAVYSQPRGNLTVGWGLLWGMLLSYASRVADAIGKRINVIFLSYDATGIISATTTKTGLTHGWLVNGMHVDWNPNNASGLADRLKTLCTVTAPGALTAEGSTKSLKILAVAGMQGETEATTATGRAQYKNLLPTFYRWIVKAIFDAGYSYYDSVEKMPVLHPGLYKTLWESAGASTDDTDGIVNSAITNFTAKTPFAGTIDVNSSDVSGNHFDAVGETENAVLLAAETLVQIDDALSSEEDLNDAVAIEICNMALAYIGDVAKISSLNTTTDTSAQANYCNKFYSEARKILLQGMAWSFATKREALVKVDDARDDEWAYAYGVPNNAVRVFAVIPDEAGDDISSGLRGTAVVKDSSGALRNLASGLYVPRPFTVEQDDDGHQIIYTDVDDAIARFNVLISDASEYPPLFKNALALKLASMLAGPIMKGAEGVQMTASLLQMLELELGKAREQDAIQHNAIPDHTPPAIQARF